MVKEACADRQTGWSRVWAMLGIKRVWIRAQDFLLALASGLHPYYFRERREATCCFC